MESFFRIVVPQQTQSLKRHSVHHRAVLRFLVAPAHNHGVGTRSSFFLWRSARSHPESQVLRPFTVPLCHHFMHRSRSHVSHPGFHHFLSLPGGVLHSRFFLCSRSHCFCFHLLRGRSLSQHTVACKCNNQ